MTLPQVSRIAERTATLEISNTTPLPAKIYANEGIAQVVLFAADETCVAVDVHEKGKYRAQREITSPIYPAGFWATSAGMEYRL